jgi:hypothetical protein
MKYLAWCIWLPLLAQTPAPPAKEPVPSPAPAEDWLQGSIEVGYRWVSIGGSDSTYRSIVNLGQGPRLLGADFTIINPTHKYFDKITVQANSWGGDPYNTLRVNVSRESLYRLSVDYRNIAYYNFLPSYADPTLPRGTLLDWNAFDTRIRTSDAQLDLFPGRKIQPYFGYSRNSQAGRGISSLYESADEFAVASSISSQNTTYRAGVQVELWRGHMTLEEGGTTFKDDQGYSNTTATFGDVLTPVLGAKQTLQGLGIGYNVRGHSYYSKGIVAMNPTSWLTVSGDFIFAQPVTNTKFTDALTGTLYSSTLLQLIGGQTDLLFADARMPHSTGSINVEVRPTKRLRVISYFLTDHLHNAAGALLTQTLLAGTTPVNLSQLSSDRLVVNQNQEEVDLFYDLTSHLTLRGGYRYVWGDSQVRAELQAVPFENGRLSRNVGIGGITYRLGQKLRIVGDFEASQSDQSFYRTSLRNYQKARIRASYDLFSTLRLSGDFTLLNNNDPDPLVHYEFKTKAESLSAFWTPKTKKQFSLLLDYTRSTVHSDILYLIPQNLTTATSYYRDNAHTGTALGSYRWFSLGGSFVVSSGSRPTQYYQPLARVSVPVRKGIQWNAEWRYYGYTESFYGYENFRSNQFTTSLRLTR